jgi:hypothetical protein
VVVSLLVFPVRAHERLSATVGRALGLLADLIGQLSDEIAGRGDPKVASELHYEIRLAITQAESIAEEAARERRSHLTAAPDPQPVCRTLRRLRHDLTMIGRTMDEPFPASIPSPLLQTAERAAAEIGAYLRHSEAALAHRGKSPSFADLQQAFAAHAAVMAQVRQAGATHMLSDEVVGRIFGLAFGFEQLSENLKDLAARVDEYAGYEPTGRRRLTSEFVSVR